jgi:hypothetical protein
MARSPESQSIHDNMVGKVVTHLANKNFTGIQVDHLIGYQQPAKIIWKGQAEGHIPDVTTTGPQKLILEVETAETITETHTKDQWKLFAAHAVNIGGEFWAVIPSGHVSTVSMVIQDLGIAAKIWEM